MLRRAITFLLAVVLSWTAIAAQERTLRASDLQQVSTVAAVDSASNVGSVEDHHLDDRPAADTSGDLQWFPATRMELCPITIPVLRPGSRVTSPIADAANTLLRPPRP